MSSGVDSFDLRRAPVPALPRAANPDRPTAYSQSDMPAPIPSVAVGPKPTPGPPTAGHTPAGAVAAVAGGLGTVGAVLAVVGADAVLLAGAGAAAIGGGAGTTAGAGAADGGPRVRPACPAAAAPPTAAAPTAATTTGASTTAIWIASWMNGQKIIRVWNVAQAMALARVGEKPGIAERND